MVNPIPPLEDRCQQIVTEARLTAVEIRVLWETFQKYDRGGTGVITQDQFHTIVNDEELLFFFGMCLFDLIGARNYKALNFSDFTYALITLSLFGQEELLRFAFNCFDPERNGTIDLSDYNMMSRLLHARSSIVHGVTALTHNVETVLARMDKWVQDDLRIDYDEFVETNRLYPWIMKPAEKFRRKIRNVTFGDDWWRDRITMLHWERQSRMELLLSSEKRKNRWESRRQKRADLRKVRRRMGNIFFYMCPFMRPFFKLSIWDPKRKVSKLKNDAIKARLETRYKVVEVVPYEEVKVKEKEIVKLPPKPRVEDKQDRREERKNARREKRGVNGMSREDRAARNKERRAEKTAKKKAGRTAKL
jgi:Ca2+-binding EF-hand superfamily protein